MVYLKGRDTKGRKEREREQGRMRSSISWLTLQTVTTAWGGSHMGVEALRDWVISPAFPAGSWIRSRDTAWHPYGMLQLQTVG